MRARALIAAALAAAAPPSAVAAAPSSLVQQGHHLYGEYCVACHGAGGNGRGGGRTIIGAGPGRAQTTGVGTAPSLIGVGALAADFYLRTGYMPLQKIGVQPRRSRVLFDEHELRALIAYVASLGKGPPVPHPQPARGNLSEGERLFAANCAGCHQIVARGGYVTDAVPPPLTKASPTQVAQAVRIGPYVMPRFSKRQISDAQLNSIVRYVQYVNHPDNPGGWGIGEIGPVPEGLVTWFIGMAVLVAVCVVLGKRLRRRGA